MSYDYFLTRLKSPPISSLREFDSADCLVDWGYAMEEVRDKLNELYPSAQDQWEYHETDYKGDPNPSFWGQVLDMSGRFEFIISNFSVPHLSIKGSHHVNQKEEVIKIAKLLGLSAFDVQTGERIYLQDT
jgi:hypothetical protein